MEILCHTFMLELAGKTMSYKKEKAYNTTLSEQFQNLTEKS